MKYVFLLLTCLICVGSAFAQTNTYKNEIGFQSDNDGFLAQKSDRYYTAGNFFFFRHALQIADLDNLSLAKKVFGLELGQKIYTPQTGAIPDPAYIDRPFAGYLYLAPSLNLLYKNESSLKLEAQIGMVGPHAYGEQIQDLIHNTFGFYHPTGWQYQIHDAFQFNLSAQYNRLLARADLIDLSVNAYGNIGTGIDGAGAGLMARFGRFNQFFNSASTNSTVGGGGRMKPLHDSELFLYYKPVLNYVAYDATIQGGLFESQPGTDEIESTKVSFLFTNQIGGSYVKNHWVLNAYVIFENNQTEEMALTKHSGHQWGAVSALYRF